MRIGIISDVHANLSAFKAVIDDALNSNVDKFIFVGDVLGIGPRPKECLDLLRELNLLACVRGNHDECISILNEEFYEHPKFVKTYIRQMYEVEQLTPTDFDYLSELPFVQYIRIGKLKIKVMHALEENTSYPNLLAYCEQENFDKMLENDDSDLVIYGHIHRQIYRTTSDNRYIINPGSVGSTFGYNPILIGHAQYCILTIDDYIVSNEFRSVKYDISNEITELEKRNPPYSELIINELKTGEYFGYNEMYEHEEKNDYLNMVLDNIKKQKSQTKD